MYINAKYKLGLLSEGKGFRFKNIYFRNGIDGMGFAIAHSNEVVVAVPFVSEGGDVECAVPATNYPYLTAFPDKDGMAYIVTGEKEVRAKSDQGEMVLNTTNADNCPVITDLIYEHSHAKEVEDFCVKANHISVISQVFDAREVYMRATDTKFGLMVRLKKSEGEIGNGPVAFIRTTN